VPPVLLVVAGPSGVGKGTIVRELVRTRPGIWLSVSATTRPPRPNEVDGRDYRFVDREQFEQLQVEEGFLEAFEVYGKRYGTPLAPLVQHLDAGEDVVLEIDVQGALAVRKEFPDAVLVFVRPPSRAEQRRRLVEREASHPGFDPASLEPRLAAADAEEALADRFDHVIVNDDVNRATAEVAAILEGSRNP
jgi:guanylate kinase